MRFLLDEKTLKCPKMYSHPSENLYLYKNVIITLAGGASGVAYNDAAGLPQHGYIAQLLPASVQQQPSRYTLRGPAHSLSHTW